MKRRAESARNIAGIQPMRPASLLRTRAHQQRVARVDKRWSMGCVSVPLFGSGESRRVSRSLRLQRVLSITAAATSCGMSFIDSTHGNLPVLCSGRRQDEPLRSLPNGALHSRSATPHAIAIGRALRVWSGSTQHAARPFTLVDAVEAFCRRRRDGDEALSCDGACRSGTIGYERCARRCRARSRSAISSWSESGEIEASSFKPTTRLFRKLGSGAAATVAKVDETKESRIGVCNCVTAEKPPRKPAHAVTRFFFPSPRRASRLLTPSTACASTSHACSVQSQLHDGSDRRDQAASAAAPTAARSSGAGRASAYSSASASCLSSPSILNAAASPACIASPSSAHQPAGGSARALPSPARAMPSSAVWWRHARPDAAASARPSSTRAETPRAAHAHAHYRHGQNVVCSSHWQLLKRVGAARNHRRAVTHRLRRSQVESKRAVPTLLASIACLAITVDKHLYCMRRASSFLVSCSFNQVARASSPR
eukprot:5146012-Pleurochrysis_carterae.AAC.3